MNQPQENVRKFQVHEEAAHEKRNWIRLTSMCNNKCTFCLDTLAHNGTYGEDEEIKARLIEGRRNGATRLILSGGEPTIHPNFIKFIKYGHMAGYRRIQTVTNGRMFSYPHYLERCLAAGLGEITFSIHGHNDKVHDALVGVKGAFEEEVRGLELALKDPRVIVNVDVCLNKANIRHLPELLDRFTTLGVSEFDLLHLIPFGSAWDEKHRDRLVYDIEEAAPYIRHALEYSERPGIHIWFNRFPAPYLENHEHLIQEPYKLNDEARGRYEEYELWLTRGRPLTCREPDRCERCYLSEFCDTLESTMSGISRDEFDVFRIDAAGGESPMPPPGNYAFSWLVASNWQQAMTLGAEIEGTKIILDLENYEGLEQAPDAWASRIDRLVIRKSEDLDRFIQSGSPHTLHVYLNHDTVAYLLEHREYSYENVVLDLEHYDLASESAELLPDLRGFFTAFEPAVPVERIPACISGRAPRAHLRVLDEAMLRKPEAPKKAITPGDTGGGRSILRVLNDLSTGDPAKKPLLDELARWGVDMKRAPIEKGRMDIFGYSKHYIRELYNTKSLRCRSCKFDQSCSGLHINHVRAHGYQLLQPIIDVDES